VDVSQCHFLVDRASPHQRETRYETLSEWEIVRELPFLVSERQGGKDRGKERGRLVRGEGLERGGQ